MKGFKELIKYSEGKLSNNNKLVQGLEYVEILEKKCKIAYIPDISIKEIESVFIGLNSRFYYQTNDFKEKSKIKLNVKDYLKFYRYGKTLVRIDAFLGGKLDTIFIVYNIENNRILKPFNPETKTPLDYHILTEIVDDFVKEESIFTEKQIFLHTYEKKTDEVTFYKYINYLPSADIFNIQEYSEAKFTQKKNKIEKQTLYKKSWVGDYRKTRLTVVHHKKK